MKNIDSCNGVLKKSYISTNNVNENDLNTIIKYIMVKLTTDREHLYKRGDRMQDIM